MSYALTSTTDYFVSTGDPAPYLRHIAAAGFRHLHWCHEWNTDRLYTREELDPIETLLRELGLSIHDIHGSAGQKKSWGSPDEEARKAGVALVANRIEMAQRFGCGVVIMHAPTEPAAPAEQVAYWDRFRRTLDELEPVCRRGGVRLALENMASDNFDTLERAFREYAPSFVGLCYDPGHGNMAGNGLDRLERAADRLIALHLNDNNGKSDLHQPLFAGTVDWPRLAAIIARSPYDRPCLGTEVVIQNSGIADEAAFLAAVLEGGQRLTRLVEES